MEQAKKSEQIKIELGLYISPLDKTYFLYYIHLFLWLGEWIKIPVLPILLSNTLFRGSWLGTFPETQEKE